MTHFPGRKLSGNIRELRGRGAESDWNRTETDQNPRDRDQEGGTYGKGSANWAEGHEGFSQRSPERWQ